MKRALIFTARFRRTRGLAVTFFAIIRPLLSWYHREEEEGGEGERGGPTVWRRREEGRGVVPPCGGRGRGGCSAFVRSPLASLGAAWGREEEVQHL